MDNWMSGLRIKLNAVCIANVKNMTGKLNDCHLHAKAQAKEWNVIFTRIADRGNHALNTTITKAARNDNTGYIL